jgi:hypothetical protein
MRPHLLGNERTDGDRAATNTGVVTAESARGCRCEPKPRFPQIPAESY